MLSLRTLTGALAPMAEVDLDFLARQFKITGGVISTPSHCARVRKSRAAWLALRAAFGASPGLTIRSVGVTIRNAAAWLTVIRSSRSAIAA